MRIGFIGAGKVGCTLGRYIALHGGELVGYYSKSEESARWASEFTSTVVYRDLGELVAACDALFLTVPDGAIGEIWNSLRQYSLEGKCICHCSGAESSAVFSDIDQMKAFGYSIHPLFAIHSKSQSYQELSQAFFTIEGSEKYLNFWESYFSNMGNPVKVIDKADKVLYHAGAAVCSNLVAGLYGMSVHMLNLCGFEKDEAKKALLPLFCNNCANIGREGPVQALTGPVERNDIKTVKAHLMAMKDADKDNGQLLMIYRGLTKYLVDIAGEKHPDRDYSELQNLVD